MDPVMNRPSRPAESDSDTPAAAAAAAAGSISGWLLAVRRGDSIAAGCLWDRYFEQLLNLARGFLEKRSRTTVFDEEDVAASVLGELFIKLRQGGHDDVQHREQLWYLLVAITVRKAAELARREKALKRGGGHVALESEIAADGPFRLDYLIGEDLAKTLPTFMSEQCRQLIESLNAPDLEQIALWKLAGHTNEEIAAQQNCTRVTIQRKLRLIRAVWIAEGGLAESNGWVTG
jgi:DNA-directed RNA polymerase specialized sigma24 family protein